METMDFTTPSYRADTAVEKLINALKDRRTFCMIVDDRVLNDKVFYVGLAGILQGDLMDGRDYTSTEDPKIKKHRIVYQYVGVKDRKPSNNQVFRVM